MKSINNVEGYGDILFTNIKQIYEECMTNKLTTGINTKSNSNSNTKTNNNKTKKNNYCYQ